MAGTATAWEAQGRAGEVGRKVGRWKATPAQTGAQSRMQLMQLMAQLQPAARSRILDTEKKKKKRQLPVNILNL